MELVTRTALPGDRPAVQALLRDAGLPVAGIEETGLWLVLAERAGRLAGCAGLEAHGPWVLLRSVAVSEEDRGTGLGRLLVERALAEARARGSCGVYLLTETAEEWFPRFGFRPVARQDVPADVTRSVEFHGVCDASARVLFLPLDGAPATAP